MKPVVSPFPSGGGEAAPRPSSPVQLPQPTLPSGGGALRGIDELFTVNTARGSGTMAISLPLSPGRSGFTPTLSLTYDSGAGNGPFGLGWTLTAGAVSRRTDRSLPRYQDDDESDTFLIGGDELVPRLVQQGAEWVPDTEQVTLSGQDYEVRRYRTRTEGAHARIERWTHRVTREMHWRVITQENLTTLYGRSPQARLSDPGDSRRVYQWFAEEVRDGRGNLIRFTYKAEDSAGVSAALPQEAQRKAGTYAGVYLKRVLYGNRVPHVADDWLFEAVFDYGEHGGQAPAAEESQPWLVRQDPFSTCRAGFEQRTYRLCRRVLMFHHFAELGPGPTLVRALELTYQDQPAASLLVAARQVGYLRNGTLYSSKANPPVHLEYTEPVVSPAVHTLSDAALENLPAGLEPVRFQWADLAGEGLTGILTEAAGAWYYKRNLGEGRFAPLALVAQKPGIAGLQDGMAQLVDLAGDGHLRLLTMSEAGPGFFGRGANGEWLPFAPFGSNPNVDWSDPNLRALDLTGDGRPDLLLTGDEVLVWYASLGEDGYAPAESVPWAPNEEEGPRLLFAEGSQSVYLADMNGDGLPDLVRIRNGSVCYWPNLGYGRFGARVTMDGAPWFDEPDLFHPGRLRLADLDGTGPADLLYIGRDGIRLYQNCAGNSWAPGQLLVGVPVPDDPSAVTVVDLLGRGTACLVLSSPLPGRSAPVLYADLMGGRKPYLLSVIRNNLGKETRLTYAASTQFYRADEEAGKPWVTRLPFPVQVVEKVEVRDLIQGHRFTTRYSYHHGHYDRQEREFCGFGRVDQIDTEEFEQHPHDQPPVLTRTWIHTGALPDMPGSSELFAAEYYRDPAGHLPDLPPSLLPTGLSPADWAEAVRALRGQTLRQEVFALDGTAAQAHPFSVSQHSYSVRLVQPGLQGRRPVMDMVPGESLACHCEREPSEARIAHTIILEADEVGRITRSAAVAYGRPTADPSLPAFVQGEQARMHITLAETDYTNDVVSPDRYRLRVPCETRSYEVSGISPAGAILAREELDAAIAAHTTTLRLLGRSRTYYLRDDLTGALPLGQLESLGLGSHSHHLAMTPDLIAEVYGSRVDGAALSAAGYIHSEGDPGWWMPSGRAIYPADAVDRFYLPTGMQDALGAVSTVTYDTYGLLVEAGTDPLGDQTVAENDYRLLQPWRVTDPNGNRRAVRTDELGLVVRTALMGKDGAGEGDTLDDPTTRLEYDLLRWMNEGKPAMLHTFTREKHGAANPRWQEAYTYFDGLGRQVMVKVQAEPGLAKRVNPDGTVVEVDTTPALRWVGNGRTVVNNKGNPVRQYEPYFSVTPEYEEHGALVELGVNTVVTYDALGRPVRSDMPDGTFTRVEFTPWLQRSYDANDTVLESDWYALRGSPSPAGPEPTEPEQRAAWLAARHANTPAVLHFDSLGRAIYTVADNGPHGLRTTRVEMDLARSRVRLFDAAGRQVLFTVSDLLGFPIHTEHMERGARQVLPDILRQPAAMWDGPDRLFRITYDGAHRPVSMRVAEGAGPERTLFHHVYGDAHPDAGALNLRGQLHQIYDQAGVTTIERCDFKGTVVQARQRIARNYQGPVDWTAVAAAPTLAAKLAAAEPLLEPGSFQTEAATDALGRPEFLRLPDNTEFRPSFGAGNFMQTLQVHIRGGAATPFLAGADHDARGKRLQATLGNGTVIRATLDPLTDRPMRMRTVRTADGAVLQDLRYIYDAAGLITQYSDEAQQTLYFANAVVRAEGLYEYDALYQLVRATGREHAGGVNDLPRSDGDLPPASPPHINDAAAVRTYTETYEYDALGNLTTLRHTAPGASWTRRYQYESATNRLSANSRPGDPDAGPFTAGYTHDTHGNMTRMPHLTTLVWNELDQLTQVDLGGGGRAWYVYGAGGQRVRKVVERSAGTRQERIYLGSLEIYREYRNGTLVLERQTLHVADAGGRIAQVDTKTVDLDDPADLFLPLIRYQFGNAVGSATLETDGTGAVLTYEEYHPFGTTAYRSARSAAEASLKRYRYIGRERDDETGLYYCGARYYAPWLARWTSSDPAGYADGLNLYAYAHNNPIALADPGGRTAGPRSGTGAVAWIVPPEVTTVRRFEAWARQAGVRYTGTPTYNQRTHVWSVDSWSRVRKGTGGAAPVTPPATPPPAAATPPPAAAAPPPAAAAPPAATPPNSDFGNIAPYDEQPPAVRGPIPAGKTQGPRLTENEHPMPHAHLGELTRNPTTGQPDYTDDMYHSDITLRWERRAALDKTNTGPTSDNRWLDRLRGGGRINYREDIFERSRSEMMRAARATNSAVTEENINTAILSQEGNLFRTVPLDQVLSRLPAPPPSLGQRIIGSIRRGLFETTAGRVSLGVGGALARSIIPGFVETEMVVVGAGQYLLTSGAAAAPGVGAVANALIASPGAATSAVLAGGVAGYFVGDAVESAVTEATGSRGAGVAAGTLSGAAAGAAIGAAIGSIVPGLGTAVGALIGGLAGAAAGFIGSYW